MLKRKTGYDKEIKKYRNLLDKVKLSDEQKYKYTCYLAVLLARQKTAIELAEEKNRRNKI